MTEKTLAQALKEEQERFRRRFVHATKPKGPMTMDQARDLCERMAGDPHENGTSPPAPDESGHESSKISK